MTATVTRQKRGNTTILHFIHFGYLQRYNKVQLIAHLLLNSISVLAGTALLNGIMRTMLKCIICSSTNQEFFPPEKAATLQENTAWPNQAWLPFSKGQGVQLHNPNAKCECFRGLKCNTAPSRALRITPTAFPTYQPSKRKSSAGGSLLTLPTDNTTLRLPAACLKNPREPKKGIYTPPLDNTLDCKGSLLPLPSEKPTARRKGKRPWAPWHDNLFSWNPTVTANPPK